MSTMPAPKQVTVQRPLGRALARRRRASLSLLQLTYIDSTRHALLRPPSDLVHVGEFDVRGKQSSIRLWTI